MHYQYYKWSDIVKYTAKLSAKLKSKKFDYVVGIARGGLIPATLIAESCDIGRVYSIGIKMYKGTEKKEPIVYQHLPECNKDVKILLVDDIADSGESFNLALCLLEQKGYKNITTCSLFYKPQSTYKPDHPNQP
jgi:hypoxanthine phosphoribosyltransferase